MNIAPQAQSKKKFTSLMQRLIARISEDRTNQFIIYQCLNSQDFRQLFESLDDNQPKTRIIAALFICQLLNENSKIVQSLVTRQGADPPVFPCNYLIGLNGYKLSKKQFANVLSIANKKKYKPDCLCWYINLQDLSIGQISNSNSIQFDIDPKYNIIGVSIPPQDGIKQLNDGKVKTNQNKTLTDNNHKKKYMIGKNK